MSTVIEQTLICLYCGTPTTGDEALEHVVPESLGFTDTLYAGAVCTSCNHKLGASVDAKVFNELLMAAGIVATGTPGKRGPRDNIGHKKGVVSKIAGGVELRGATVGKPHEHAMSRFLAKIVVNVLANNFGSEAVRLRQMDLIRFVTMPRSRKEVWPFEAIYVSPGFEPKVGFIACPGELDLERSRIEGVMMTCASGIFAVPFKRDEKEILERGRAMIKEALEFAKKQGGAAGFSMGYSAENCEGGGQPKSKKQK